MICSGCGIQVREGSKFCPSCGARMRETDRSSCPQCGAELRLGSSFCSSCGARDMANEEQEEILGIFWMAQGGQGLLTTQWPCILCFSTNRLIVAKATRILARLEFNTFGGGYIRSHASARDRLKMGQKSPDVYLEGNLENFAVPYSDINAVELENGRLSIFCEDLGVPKYRFLVAQSRSNPERASKALEEFLRETLPDKV